jgi:flavin reductase (DIM6/NTAB) family NADH-FMN oxidoreductase RutF
MKKFLRNILFGQIPVKEYATITVEDRIHERVYLETGGIRKDISGTHWLLCLNPVVFGIWFANEDVSISFAEKSGCLLDFMDSESNGTSIASLRLEFLNKIAEQDGTLVLLKLSRARIHHLHFIRISLLYYKYYRKPEQNLKILKSFAAAYSYPRRVRLISFREGEEFNIFPMDLVGDIPFSTRYVFGLRHSNVTLSRIVETKKMAVSEVSYEFSNVIYELGKHHREPLSKSDLVFDLVQSEKFHFPIPAWADSYKEIRITSTMNLGSHMLLWGEEVNEKILSPEHQHLYHIHFLHYLHQMKKKNDYPVVR